MIDSREDIKTKADLEREIYEGVGHASMCWTETPRGEFDEKEATIASEKIMDAALSYSKQVSIEFTEWCSKNYYMDEDGFYNHEPPYQKHFSISELYELFSKQTEGHE
jgi:hypothetical protein